MENDFSDKNHCKGCEQIFFIANIGQRLKEKKGHLVLLKLSANKDVLHQVPVKCFQRFKEK